MLEQENNLVDSGQLVDKSSTEIVDGTNDILETSELKDKISNPYTIANAVERANEKYGKKVWMQEEYLKKAEERGEKIIEIPVTITVKIGEGELVRMNDRSGVKLDGYDLIDSCIDAAEANVLPEFVKAIREKIPEVILADVQVRLLRKELDNMTIEVLEDPEDDFSDKILYQTETYSLDRAEQILQELADIEMRFSKTTNKTDDIRERKLIREDAPLKIAIPKE